MSHVSKVGAAGSGCIRVLHSVGHLSRGGIENWLYGIVQHLAPPRFEHHVMVWTDEEEAFTAEFRAAGVKVHPLVGHTRPLHFAQALRGLVRRAGPFDVLHTHGTQFHGLVLALGKALGIPIRIAHSHTDVRPVLRDSGIPYRIYAGVGHSLIRRFATAGCGVSEVAAVSMFGATWRSEPRWRILFCGVDLDRFRHSADPVLRARLGIPAERLVIGHVGRFEAQKNHQFLLGVLAELLARGVDAHLLLVGDGSLRAGFEAALVERELTGRCTIIPDSQDVPSLMVSAMDAFALPSLYEGLPLVLVEAQAAGLPCLVSEAAAQEAIVCPELVCRLPLSAGAAGWAAEVSSLPARRDPRDPGLQARVERSSFGLNQSAAELGRLYESETARARP